MDEGKSFSVKKLAISIIISAILILVLYIAVRYYFLGNKISDANSNAKTVSESADRWIADAKSSGEIVAGGSGKLIFKSDPSNRTKSVQDDNNDFNVMDLTSYLKDSFTGNWYVVVDAATLKIDYALWSENVIPDDKTKSIEKVSDQLKLSNNNNVIGCYPIKNR